MVRTLSLAAALGIAAFASIPATAAVMPMPSSEHGGLSIDLAQYYGERRYRDDDDYDVRRRRDWERRRYENEMRRDRSRGYQGGYQGRRQRDDDDD